MARVLQQPQEQRRGMPPEAPFSQGKLLRHCTQLGETTRRATGWRSRLHPNTHRLPESCVLSVSLTSLVLNAFSVHVDGLREGLLRRCRAWLQSDEMKFAQLGLISGQVMSCDPEGVPSWEKLLDLDWHWRKRNHYI